MEDVDDQMLEAAETLILCSRSPVNFPAPEIRDLRPSNLRQSATRFEMIPTFIPSWGLQSKRSRCFCISKPQTEDDDSVGPASKTIPSPATPLEYGNASAPSTSGSDNAPTSPAAKRRRAAAPSPSSGDVRQKVGAVDLLPLDGVAIPSKPIRRQGKKKKITELQGQERFLADENTILRKSLESKLKEMDTLMENNRRLLKEKSSLQQSRAAEGAAKTRFFLPDLNEPATEI